MDIEYHFYITYIIALRAGYDRERAYKIAYSSQYTDDNNRVYEINKGKPDAYDNYISQTYNILRPKKELIRIHPAFHFFPGTGDEILNCSAPRRDGKLHLLNTTPGNTNAQKLMKAALKTDNPCRIGIATHTFADTYSHQNFTGMKDEFNAMKGLFSRLIPNIGHADAQHNPDLPALKWKDDRLNTKFRRIDNKERFLSAAGHIFELYRLHLEPKCPEKRLNTDRSALQGEISRAVGAYDRKNRNKKRRIDRYKKLIGDDLAEDYNKRTWFKAAVRQRREEVVDYITDSRSTKVFYSWKENYKKSDWYQFQEAVKAHQEKAMKIMHPVLEQMEIAKLGMW